MIGSHDEVKGQNDTPGRIMATFESDGVKAEFDRIKACGALVVAEPYQPDKDKSADTWLATLADPDGNYFQLTTPWK
jgi:predicted enzyme related to lactoylglutathione lyase